MKSLESPSFLGRRIGGALERGLKRAYGRFGVNPGRYLEELRRGHGLPIRSFGDVFELHPAALDNNHLPKTESIPTSWPVSSSTLVVGSSFSNPCCGTVARGGQTRR